MLAKWLSFGGRSNSPILRDRDRPLLCVRWRELDAHAYIVSTKARANNRLSFTFLLITELQEGTRVQKAVIAIWGY
jgi:hypothetical protein